MYDILFISKKIKARKAYRANLLKIVIYLQNTNEKDYTHIAFVYVSVCPRIRSNIVLETFQVES